MLRRLLILLLLVPVLRAHQIDEMTMRLETTSTGWTARIALDAAYMLPEYRGDAEIAPLDLAWLRTREPAEWQRIREESARYLDETLVFSGGTDALRFPDFDTTPPRFATEGIPEGLPELEVVLEGSAPGGPLEISWDEPFGVVLLVEHEGKITPLVPGDRVRLGEPWSFLRWIRFGFRHILPDGLDHILFVLGIFLLMPKWKPLLYQSLTFTAAHSLTLAAAALGWVALPSRWVETAIALSISWIALENLKPREPDARRYAIIGVFGLVHGLGFASMLAEAMAGSGQVIAPLLGFNLGVEIGQVAVLAGAFALAGWWKEKAFHILRIAGSGLITLTGLVWAIERAFS